MLSIRNLAFGEKP